MTIPNDHQGLPVDGYRPQSDANVQRVNSHKQQEEQLLRLLDWLSQQEPIDKRWLAIARTHFEQGFMALNRSVFKPARVTLAVDE